MELLNEALDKFAGAVQLSNRKVQVLLYADHIVMVIERKEDIQKNHNVCVDGSGR